MYDALLMVVLIVVSMVMGEYSGCFNDCIGRRQYVEDEGEGESARNIDSYVKVVSRR